ncbi:hypothetical protein SDC9_99762 [bioreactor metagenome]|uniref:Uncharacterized protein n=1 Tax=bioreactor metagenome TaxID=1076179 RepID=A0A645AJS8_9ZZZZ
MTSCCTAAGVEEREFVGVQLVLADKAPGLDPPQALADAKVRQELLLRPGQTERGRGRPELVGLLPVHDPSLGIRKQRVGQRPHGGALVAYVVEVGELVEDQHVRDPVVPGESPVRIHPSQQCGVGHEPPGFVVDDPPLPAVRVE